MVVLIRYLLLLLLIRSSLVIVMSQTSIDFDNGYYLIDGEKVFLRGVGYEHNAKPGQLPWEDHFNEAELRFDMERILKAGFNALRTWDAFTEEELTVIEDYDLYIIMGIWIDPHGDFSNPSLIAEAVSRVEQVMSYAASCDKIIGYLIMNEPLPETIFAAGYDKTVELWTTLIETIHQQHPGIPVSIANTPNGTYIDPQIFEYSAFNVYIYNPVTVNHSHKYAAYVEYLSSLRSDDHPLLISEFGLSTSPSGPGNWEYGGNDLTEQSEGNMHMYRASIDGGATGAFMFNYADGWWKGGNEFVHDDHPEEWFGLVAYENLQDHMGTPRPVWEAISVYNRAIITSPKNGGIYPGIIPIELFLDDTISSFQVLNDGNLLHYSLTPSNYYSDTVLLGSAIQDVLLTFRFFNIDYDLLKQEEIQILLIDDSWQMPELTIETSLETWNQPEQIEISVEIIHDASLDHSTMLEYATYKHLGFEYGYAYEQVLPADIDNYIYSYLEYITEQSPVITFAAGYDLVYGNFSKRVYDQEVLVYEGYMGNWPDDIAEKEILVIVYPNPSSGLFSFTYDEPYLDGLPFTVYDAFGQPVLKDVVTRSKYYDLSNVTSGYYLVQIPGNAKQITLGLLIR